MKYIALFCLVLASVSCQPDEVPVDPPLTCEDTMVCDVGCLFDVYNLAGEMRFANCFGLWGIVCSPESQEEEVLILLEEVPESFREDGQLVVISATTFENTFPLLLPDPEPMPRLVKGELCELSVQSR